MLKSISMRSRVYRNHRVPTVDTQINTALTELADTLVAEITTANTKVTVEHPRDMISL